MLTAARALIKGQRRTCSRAGLMSESVIPVHAASGESSTRPRMLNRSNTGSPSSAHTSRPREASASRVTLHEGPPFKFEELRVNGKRVTCSATAWAAVALGASRSCTQSGRRPSQRSCRRPGRSFCAVRAPPSQSTRRRVRPLAGAPLPVDGPPLRRRHPHKYIEVPKYPRPT